MFDLFRGLTQTLGSPKDQKSEQMAIAVMFTTFLGFVITMTAIVTMGRSAIQIQPTVSYPPDFCSSIAEHLPNLPDPISTPNRATDPASPDAYHPSLNPGPSRH
jgi:hypothetical protein